MSRSGRKAMAATALVALLALAGCAGGGGTAPAVEPGLYDLGGGRWRAVGTLRHEDLEGGFWAVYSALPGKAGGRRLAVVANAERLGAARLEGRYVEAVGTRKEGVSIRMSGPEIEADTLREVPAR